MSSKDAVSGAHFPDSESSQSQFKEDKTVQASQAAWHR